MAKTTTYTRKRLLEIHDQKATADYGWISALRAKEIYDQPRSTMVTICNAYNVPMVNLGKGSTLISQPAFEHVLTHSPELLDCSGEDSAMARLDRLQAESDKEVKAAMRAKLEQQLANA